MIGQCEGGAESLREGAERQRDGQRRGGEKMEEENEPVLHGLK